MREGLGKGRIITVILFSLAVAIVFGEDPLPRSLLSSSPVSIDLGTHSAWVGQEASFRLHNGSQATIRLVKVRTSCGCSEARVERDVLPPGEETELTVHLKPNTLKGPYTKHVFVHWQAEEAKAGADTTADHASPSGVLRVTVRGKAVPLVSVRPEGTIALGQVPTGQELRRELAIQAGNAPVEFGKPEAPEGVTVEMERTLLPAGESVPLAISLAPRKPGVFREVVSIPVVSPEGHPPVSILLYGTAVGNEDASAPAPAAE